MNSLSWLIYAIHLFGNLGALLATLAFASFGILAIVTICRLVGNNDRIEKYGTRGAERAAINAEIKDTNKAIARMALKFVWIPVVLGLIASVIPDRRTMYLIAASEIGERVVTSEKVVGVFDPSIDLLKNWIKSENDKIVESMKPSEKK